MTDSRARAALSTARGWARRTVDSLTGREDLAERLAQSEDLVARLRRDRAHIRRVLASTRADLARTSADRDDAQAGLLDAEARLRSAVSDVDDLPDSVLERIAAVRAENLAFLGAPQLSRLAATMLEIEENHVPGLVVEAGTARGGSAIVLAAAKSPERAMKVYDVFGMIPPPTEADGQDVHDRYAKIVAGNARGTGGETYYGYRDDLYGEVVESFDRHGLALEDANVELVRGLFQDTIDLDEPVALAHLDGDWYESTMTCLERIAPLLAPGGRIVLDDYYQWSGCRTAVDEYFAERDGYRMERRGRMHVVREA